MNLFFERYYDQLDMERSKNLINRTVSGQNLFWHSTLLGPAYLNVSKDRGVGVSAPPLMYFGFGLG